MFGGGDVFSPWPFCDALKTSTQKPHPFQSFSVWPLVLLIPGAICIVYGPAINAPFICDDSPTIVENESIRRLWPLWGDGSQLGPLSKFRGCPVAARPLANLSLALNYKLGQLHPRGYRIVNIAIHTLAALLLCVLLRRTLRLPYFAGRFDHVAGALGFLIAFLWAMHPLVTEAVVCITQRTELMVSFCYLAVLYCSLRFWDAKTPNNRALWLMAATLSCFAGAASKEIMVVAPIVVLIFERTFVSGSFRAALRESGPLYIGLFASWGLSFGLQFDAPHSDSAGFHLGVAATEWWYTQCQVLLMYLKLAVWPWPLSIHYEPPYLTSLREAWMYVVPVVLLVVGTLVLLWRRSAVGYLAAFALAILAPTLVVPIVTEIAAERRMYLPLAALVTLVIVGGYVALRHVLAAKYALVTVVTAALLLACVGGVVSRTRLAAYDDELTLWRDVVIHDSMNATAQYNVGTIHLERHAPDQAVHHFERAIELRPEYARAHHNLGAALSALGRRAEATREFERAVELEPRYALGHVKLGITAMQAGRTAEAKEHFRAALHWQPNDAAAHRGLAGALLKDGELDDATRHARAAVDAAPEDAESLNSLGAALAQQGLFPEAVEHFEAAVRLDPNMLQAQGNLMAAYASLGRRDEALATARMTLELARKSGDQAIVEQINTFLDHFQSQPTDAPATAGAKE